jgi:hypothetical protein
MYRKYQPASPGQYFSPAIATLFLKIGEDINKFAITDI